MDPNDKPSTSHTVKSDSYDDEDLNNVSTAELLERARALTDTCDGNTSQILKSDSSDDDDDDDHFKNLTTEEIHEKIKTFSSLCVGNKINVSNAFDIDMVGYLYSWLERTRNSNVDDSDTSFQEISEYLEATAQVYSYRVDNLTESTKKLVEEIKSMNLKSTTPKDDDNEPKIQKTKRHKMMPTTNKRIKLKLDENDIVIKSSIPIHHADSSFDCNELSSASCSSSHLTSMYHGKTLAEEMKNSKDGQKEFDEKKITEETTEIDQNKLTQ